MFLQNLRAPKSHGNSCDALSIDTCRPRVYIGFRDQNDGARRLRYKGPSQCMGMPKARNAFSRNTSNMPHLVELHKKCLANMRQHTGVPKQVNLRRDSAAAEARDSGQCSCLRLSVFLGRGPTETPEAVVSLSFGHVCPS